MMRRAFRSVAAALWASAVLPLVTHAQSATREACTQGDLFACARVDLTRSYDSGNTLLALTIGHVRVFAPLELMTQPSMVWFLTFATGGADDGYNEYGAALEASGGAALTDATPWTFADQGNLWALFYPSYDDPDFTTRGVGGSVTAAGNYVDASNYPWRQIGTTSADGGITFRVTLPYLWEANLDAFQIAGLEAVSLTADYQGRELLAGSCGDESSCRDAPLTTVPEPSTTALLTFGLLALAHAGRRRAVRGARTPDRELT